MRSPFFILIVLTAPLSLYQKITRLTALSIFLLFLFGGLVRATGSGMGCPDWPKCFGLLAPPTCECDLKPGYETIFLEKRLAKVQKMAAVLDGFGMTGKANELRHNEEILKPEKFNALKAWIEYINRLFGVLSGLLALASLFLAFKYRKTIKKVFWWTVIGFVLLLVNAWLGSIVVATNLLPGIVSIHFLAAFLCLYAFILALQAERPLPFATGFKGIASFIPLLTFVFIFTIVMLGVFSRELVEQLILNDNLVKNGELNHRDMGFLFVLHRYLPFILLGTIAYIIRLHKKESQNYKILSWILILSVLQIGLGVINIKWVLPVWTQTVHVVLGACIPVLAFIYYRLYTQWETIK